MWLPDATANEPFAPVTVPAVVVPSPQLMVAVKSAAVSLVLVSVKVATVVLVVSATPSVADGQHHLPGQRLRHIGRADGGGGGGAGRVVGQGDRDVIGPGRRIGV